MPFLCEVCRDLVECRRLAWPKRQWKRHKTWCICQGIWFRIESLGFHQPGTKVSQACKSSSETKYRVDTDQRSWTLLGGVGWVGWEGCGAGGGNGGKRSSIWFWKFEWWVPPKRVEKLKGGRGYLIQLQIVFFLGSARRAHLPTGGRRKGWKANFGFRSSNAILWFKGACVESKWILCWMKLAYRSSNLKSWGNFNSGWCLSWRRLRPGVFAECVAAWWAWSAWCEVGWEDLLVENFLLWFQKPLRLEPWDFIKRFPKLSSGMRTEEWMRCCFSHSEGSGGSDESTASMATPHIQDLGVGSDESTASGYLKSGTWSKTPRSFTAIIIDEIKSFPDADIRVGGANMWAAGCGALLLLFLVLLILPLMVGLVLPLLLVLVLRVVVVLPCLVLMQGEVGRNDPAVRFGHWREGLFPEVARM